MPDSYRVGNYALIVVDPASLYVTHYTVLAIASSLRTLGLSEKMLEPPLLKLCSRSLEGTLQELNHSRQTLR